MEQLTHYPPMTQPDIESDLKDKPPSGKTVMSAQFLQFFAILFGLALIFGAALSYFKLRLDNVPKDYQACVQRPGSRLQKTVPPTCITLEGNYFIGTSTMPVQPSTPPSILSSPTPASVNALTCIRSGCSGQLCVEINAPDQISTCEYRAEYSCYQEAPCERQTDGQCGFTPSAAFTACLVEKKAAGVGLQ
ncbi:MAG: hypothetical protein ABI425_05805 [Patescibacteria group bacterium]